jgi:hypothetical protein
MGWRRPVTHQLHVERGNPVKMDGTKRHDVVSCTYDAKKYGAAKEHGVVLWGLAA